MHPVLLLLLLSLATYRATRLVVRDEFPPIRYPRERVDRWALRDDRGRLEWLGDLVTCHWCASGWISMALVVGVDLLSRVSIPLPVVFWAATWALGALLAHLEPEK